MAAATTVAELASEEMREVARLTLRTCLGDGAATEALPPLLALPPGLALPPLLVLEDDWPSPSRGTAKLPLAGFLTSLSEALMRR